jgi:hypothetical protein
MRGYSLQRYSYSKFDKSTILFYCILVRKCFLRQVCDKIWKFQKRKQQICENDMQHVDVNRMKITEAATAPIRSFLEYFTAGVYKLSRSASFDKYTSHVYTCPCQCILVLAKCQEVFIRSI